MRESNHKVTGGGGGRTKTCHMFLSSFCICCSHTENSLLDRWREVYFMQGAGGFLCESLRAREQSKAIMSSLYKNLWSLSDILQMTSRELQNKIEQSETLLSIANKVS